MTQVRELTAAQKDLLIDIRWNDNTTFNPVLDADGKWFISNVEVDGCIYDECSWVKDLPYINHNPIIEDI